MAIDCIVGEGTKQLSLLQTGDLLNCVFPLGRGFTLPSAPQERILLVGGGVGVAPLLYLGHVIRQSGGMLHSCSVRVPRPLFWNGNCLSKPADSI